jgi:hypothetical protein
MGVEISKPVRQACELAIMAELVAALPLGAHFDHAEICFDDVLGMKLDHFTHVGAGTTRQRLLPVLARCWPDPEYGSVAAVRGWQIVL